MKEYDQFLTWAAERSYEDWLNDRVSWGESQFLIVETGAMIYERPMFNVAEAICTRVNNMYGNRL